jgi:hypothetical protein
MMTVKNLIEILAQQDPAAPVAIAYPAGDYLATTVAVGPRKVGPARGVWTEYHGAWMVLDDDPIDSLLPDGTREVLDMVVIR